MQFGSRAIISFATGILVAGLVLAQPFAYFAFNLLGFDGARLAGYTIAPAMFLFIGLVSGLVGAVFDKRADDIQMEKRRAELGLLTVAPSSHNKRSWFGGKR